MGKMYALASSLCFSEDYSSGDEDVGGHRGRAAFMRCLDAVADSRPDRPRFDSVNFIEARQFRVMRIISVWVCIGV